KPDCRPEVTTSVGEDPYAAWPEDAGWEPAPICAATGASAAARPRLRAPRLRATRGPNRSWRRTPAMRNTKSQRRPNSAKRSTVTVNSLTEAACLGVGDGGVAGGEHSALRERDGVDGAAVQQRAVRGPQVRRDRVVVGHGDLEVAAGHARVVDDDVRAVCRAAEDGGARLQAVDHAVDLDGG